MTLKLSQLIPKRTDRAVFIGKTGTGKTRLVEDTIKFRRFVVVYDTKQTINWAGFKVYRHLEQLLEAKEERLIYRPMFKELGNEWFIENFFRFIYERENTTVYVDETYQVTDPQWMADSHRGVLSQGRELGISAYHATQRPRKIPLEILSESEHVFCFRLKLLKDAQIVEEQTGIDAKKILELPDYYFYYAHQNGLIRGPLKLRI